MSLISMSNASMTSMTTSMNSANKFGLKKTFDEQMQHANQLFAEVNEEYEEWEYEQKINAELDSVEQHTGGMKKNHLIDNKVASKSKQGQQQQQQKHQQQKDALEKINKEKQAAHQRKIAETKRRKEQEEQQAIQRAATAAPPKKVKQTPLDIAINAKEKKEKKEEEEEENNNMRGPKKPYNPEVDDWEGMF